MRNMIYLILMMVIVSVTCTQRKENTVDGSAGLSKEGQEQPAIYKANSKPDKNAALKSSNKTENNLGERSSGEKDKVLAEENINGEGSEEAGISLPSIAGLKKNNPDDLQKEVKEMEEDTDTHTEEKEAGSVASTEVSSLKEESEQKSENSQNDINNSEETSEGINKPQAEAHNVLEKDEDLTKDRMEPEHVEDDQSLSLEEEGKWASIRETESLLNRISILLKND